MSVVRLSSADLMLIEQRVTNEAPSIGVAYLLCIFLGFFSAHRFYLGRPGSAVLQIVSYVFIVGFVWLIVDLFLIPGMVRAKQDGIRQKLRAVMVQAKTDEADEAEAAA